MSTRNAAAEAERAWLRTLTPAQRRSLTPKPSEDVFDHLERVDLTDNDTDMSENFRSCWGDDDE